MSWAGFALSAIASLNYNRSLTSNKNAIASYRRKARQLMGTKPKKVNVGSFKPKRYTKLEYELMKRQIRTRVRRDLFVKLGIAVIVFMLAVALMSLYFSNYPIDSYLFWAR